MAPPSDSPRAAALMRRMPQAEIFAPAISRRASDPVLRLPVEMNRGRVTLTLVAPEGAEGPIQWTQNGTPIRGETGPTLHLTGLNPDDSDLYYALLGPAAAAVRSQAAMVVVLPGNAVVNYSTRGEVAPGRPLIAGWFVARGAGIGKPKRYLLRAIGAGLKKFGVVQTVTRPTVTLHRRGMPCSELLQTDQPEFAREAAAKVGAFALDEPHTEFVAVADLAPGSYSVVVNGNGQETGEVMIEIYEL